MSERVKTYANKNGGNKKFNNRNNNNRPRNIVMTFDILFNDAFEDKSQIVESLTSDVFTKFSIPLHASRTKMTGMQSSALATTVVGRVLECFVDENDVLVLKALINAKYTTAVRELAEAVVTPIVFNNHGNPIIGKFVITDQETLDTINDTKAKAETAEDHRTIKVEETLTVNEAPKVTIETPAE